MITKKQAAAHLEVSEKTIERAVKRGELAAQYTKGANGNIVVFDESELERFKRERNAILHAPEIIADEQPAALIEDRLPTRSDTHDRHNRHDDFTTVLDEQSAALALIENQLPTRSDTYDRQDRQVDFTTVLADALALALDRRAAPLLTVKEAAQSFNCSQTAITAAIKSGSLKTHKIGIRGASVIKRADLEKWLAEL